MESPSTLEAKTNQSVLTLAVVPPPQSLDYFRRISGCNETMHTSFCQRRFMTVLHPPQGVG